MLLTKDDLIESVTMTPPATTDAAWAAWNKKDKKARALLNLSIEDTQIIHVKNLETARQT